MSRLRDMLSRASVAAGESGEHTNVRPFPTRDPDGVPTPDEVREFLSQYPHLHSFLHPTKEEAELDALRERYAAEAAARMKPEAPLPEAVAREVACVYQLFADLWQFEPEARARILRQVNGLLDTYAPADDAPRTVEGAPV